MFTSQITDAIQASLPNRRMIQLRTEPDCYGASRVISNQLGLPFTPRSLSHWQHGWIYNNIEINFPELFGIPSRYPFLTATHRHASTLNSHGHHAIAVGHPFIYARTYDDNQVSRISNSALFMPPHGLEYTTERWSELDILDSLKSYLDNYTYVAACIHPSCVEKGFWIDNLRSMNIPIFYGATMADANSLLRMNRLLSHFSTVITPCLGSHVAYAAYSGCNVIMIDPFCEWRREHLEKDVLYQQHPELLDYVCWLQSKKYCKKYFPFLFDNINLSSKVNLIEWACAELGESVVMNSLDLSGYLGWRFKPQVHDLFFRAKQKIQKNFYLFRTK